MQKGAPLDLDKDPDEDEEEYEDEVDGKLEGSYDEEEGIGGDNDAHVPHKAGGGA